MLKRWMTGVCMLGACALVAFPVWAVKPAQWSQQSEADFEKQEKKEVVITSAGEVILARKSQELARLQNEDTIIYDMAMAPDGKIYVAAGPKAKLFLYEKNELKEIAAFEGQQIFSMLSTKTGLWLGLSGAEAELVFWDWAKGEITKKQIIKDTQFIWAILPFKDKGLVLGVGAPGRVILIPEGILDAQDVILTTKQSNILTVGVGKDGVIYAGTDEEGLVYQLIPGVPKMEMVNKNEEGAGEQKLVTPYTAYVLYDAPEAEIGTMIVNADGSLYIGTSDARAARPGRLNPPAKNDSGKANNGKDTEPEKSPEPEKPVDEVVPGTQPGGDEKESSADTPSTQESNAGTGAVERSLVIANPDKFEVSFELDRERYSIKVPVHADPELMTRKALAEAIKQLDANQKRPTPEQYEQLRQVIKERLVKAREAGEMSVQRPSAQNTENQRSQQASSNRSATNRSSSSSRKKKRGNAIYHIDDLGFAREVFRETVMILDMLLWKDQLLVATGNEGQLYMVNPAKMEFGVLLETESKQILSMMKASDGAAYLGLSNDGVLLKLEPGYAKEGTLTSEVMDAEYLSLWGAMQLDLQNANGGIKIQTRSGNVNNPDDGGWSAWTDAISLTPGEAGMPARLPVKSPPARYFQYRITLSSTGNSTPRFHAFRMKYMTMNMRPEIESFTMKTSEDKSGKRVVNLAWKAADPNGDELIYTLYAKRMGTEGGYLRIAEGITDNKYKLEDLALPAGRYMLKVKASDQPDNVPGQALTAVRLSESLMIDPDVPMFKELKIESAAKQVKISGLVQDAMSDIEEIRYQLNGKEDWVYVLPNDLIYDSTSESFSITISNLSPGTHLLVIRVKDEMGNVSRKAQTITISK